MQWVSLSALHESESLYILSVRIHDWCEANNSHASATTTPLHLACHLAPTQAGIEQSNNSTACVDVLALHSSLSLEQVNVASRLK